MKVIHLRYRLVVELLFMTLLCVIFNCTKIYADSIDTHSIQYIGEIRTTFSTGNNTPFWLVNNLQGLGSPQKNNGYMRIAVFKDINHSDRFSWGAGVDIAGGYRLTSPFYIHQLYGEVKYRSLGALLGSKVIYGDFNNNRLSSGGLLYSGNAMPIPQLRVGIFDYSPIWGTNKWLSVKGYVAFGMFTDSKWQKDWVSPKYDRTENVLYHSKGIWFRGGNTEKFPITGEIGIEMATQFGGKAFLNTENGRILNMPTKFKDWLKAIFPTKGSNSIHWGESYNVQGNMLGSYNFALSWFSKSGWNIRAYYEHYFDDQSQMTFEYGWKDGLWGVDIKFPENRFVSQIVYEYIATKDQSGAVLNNITDQIPEQVSGRDNYYSNYIYVGWQHWGMGIGNPLIVSPIYNNNHRLNFVSTRLLGHHFAFSGNPVNNLSYRVLLSYTRNWGTYGRPLPEIKTNFNALAEISWSPKSLKGWYSSVGIAMDSGKLLGKSLGASITIGYNGLSVFNK